MLVDSIVLIFDVALLALLIVAIFISMRLNAQLGLLRHDRNELNRLINKMTSENERIEASINQMQRNAETTQQELSEATAQSRHMKQQLAALLRQGDGLVNRMTEKIKMSEMKYTPPPLKKRGLEGVNARTSQPVSDMISRVRSQDARSQDARSQDAGALMEDEAEMDMVPRNPAPRNQANRESGIRDSIDRDSGRQTRDNFLEKLNNLSG